MKGCLLTENIKRKLLSLKLLTAKAVEMSLNFQPPKSLSIPPNILSSTGPNEILLLARRSDIRMISLDTPDNTDVIVPLTLVQHAVAIDFDPVDGFLYWTDDDRKAIVRSRLNGSGKKTNQCL